MATVTVLSGGESTQGLAAREKLLETGRAGDRAKALSARAVLDMRVDEGKELFRDNDVVYIYHNLIDAIGDKLQTEDQLPKAAEDAIEELTKLVRKLTSANFSNILITADHGFLYQHRALDESDFAVADPNGDEILMRNRRFVIGRGLDETAGMKKFSSANLGLVGDLDVLIPNSINRLRVKGRGQSVCSWRGVAARDRHSGSPRRQTARGGCEARSRCRSSCPAGARSPRGRRR